MKLFYTFLVFIFIFSGCKTSFRISVKEPAVIKISDEVKSFAVVNNVNSTNSAEEVIGSILQGEHFKGNIVASEGSVDGVLRALDNSNLLKGTVFTSDSLHLTSSAVNWEYLERVANDKELDGFIEIAAVKTVAPVGGSIVASAQGKSNTNISGTAYINYYAVNERVSHERVAVKYNYKIPVSGNVSVFDILNDAVRRKEYYRALGFELGYKAGKLIYPNWVWVNRKYYTRGSKELKQAKPMIAKGNWDIAEKQLIYGLEAGSKKELARTYFNLALVKEGQGDVDKAIEYAETAALEYGDKLANEYLVQLRKRKRQIELLSE